jgi:hypothetical protein
LIEEEGYYMKIRPDKFSMDFNDSQEYQQSRVVASSNYPTTYLDLFSKPGATSPETPELAIPVGSSIYLFIKVIEIMMRDGKRTYMRLRITLKEITIL